MREQKNSLSKFIWMIFVTSIFADISKSVEESVEELVGTLKSNFNVAEAFRSNPASIRYTALRLLGKNVLIGDLLNIHQTLCNVKKPEFVTIITATRKLDHAQDTTTNSYMKFYFWNTKTY